MMNGFELHIYNRTDLYTHLENIFGINSKILSNNNEALEEDFGKYVYIILNILLKKVSLHYFWRNGNEKKVPIKDSDKKQKSEAAMAKTWRDLIPVIKCDVTSVSIAFFWILLRLLLHQLNACISSIIYKPFNSLVKNVIVMQLLLVI